MHGDAEFYDAEVGPEMAARFRESIDELAADLLGERREFAFGQLVQIVGGGDGGQE